MQMKNLPKIAILALTLTAVPVLAHHAAQGIVDDDVYLMIDDIVADTPHAELTIDDLGGGMTQATIDTATVRSLEGMIDDGLLTYASMLDGEIEVAIGFNDDGSVTMSVTQTP